MMNAVKMPEIKITRDKFVNYSRAFSILLIFGLYILSEFIKPSMRVDFQTDTAYWVTTVINLVLVVSIMVTTRSMRRDKKISQSTDILELMSQINGSFKTISIKGYSELLDEYIEELNKNNKYNVFIKITQGKLLKLKPSKWVFSKAGKERAIQNFENKRKELNDSLKLPKEEILKINVNYKPITFSKLFAALDGKIVNDNEFDLDTYEKQSTAKMVGTKSLMVFLFSAFSTTILVDFLTLGISALFGVLIKVFSLILAMNTAIGSADEYVDHNLKVSVNRRFKILTNFRNSIPDFTAKKPVTVENQSTE